MIPCWILCNEVLHFFRSILLNIARESSKWSLTILGIHQYWFYCRECRICVIYSLSVTSENSKNITCSLLISLRWYSFPVEFSLPLPSSWFCKVCEVRASILSKNSILSPSQYISNFQTFSDGETTLTSLKAKHSQSSHPKVACVQIVQFMRYYGNTYLIRIKITVFLKFYFFRRGLNHLSGKMGD